MGKSFKDQKKFKLKEEDMPKKRIPLPNKPEKAIDPDTVYNRKNKKTIKKQINKEIEKYYNGESEDLDE